MESKAHFQSELQMSLSTRITVHVVATTTTYFSSLNNNNDLEVAIAVAVVTGDIQGMSIIWAKSGSQGVVRDDSIKR